MKSSASNLKAHLGRYMNAVKRGQELIITHRDKPIAKLVPFAARSSLSIRPPLCSGSLEAVKLRGVKRLKMSAKQLIDDTRGTSKPRPSRWVNR